MDIKSIIIDDITKTAAYVAIYFVLFLLAKWFKDILFFALANVIAFVFLTLIRLVMDKLVVPGDSLGREIKENKNIGAGFLEATIAISFSFVLTRLI